MNTVYLVGVIILAVMVSGGIGAYLGRIVGEAGAWPEKIAASPSPELIEAMCEVDAMYPHTKPIAPQKDLDDWIWTRVKELKEERNEILREYIPELVAPFPPNWYVDPTTMELVDAEGWRAPYEAWEDRDQGRPVIFTRAGYVPRAHTWWGKV